MHFYFPFVKGKCSFVCLFLLLLLSLSFLYTEKMDYLIFNQGRHLLDLWGKHSTEHVYRTIWTDVNPDHISDFFCVLLSQKPTVNFLRKKSID